MPGKLLGPCIACHDVGAIEGEDGRVPGLERCAIPVEDLIPVVKEHIAQKVDDGDVMSIAAINNRWQILKRRGQECAEVGRTSEPGSESIAIASVVCSPDSA